MLKLATDEDFSGPLLAALIRVEPALDIVRAIDFGLGGQDDVELLEWAAQTERVLLTRDANTMTNFAISRVSAGQRMPGLFVVTQQHISRELIEQLVLYMVAAGPGDYEGQLVYFPIAG